MSDIVRTAVFIVFLGVAVVQPDDWTLCPPGCKCKWVSGKKTADCRNSELKKIPETLKSEIQSLDLSENNLDHLPDEAFKSVGLVNLHKVYLRDCNIKEVHREAFKGLGILVEVDLSENRIHVLHPGTFRDNVRLRVFYFNGNLIRRIEANLFVDLNHLQTVEMGECEITEIDDKAFRNVSNLLNLKLNANKLTHLKLSTFSDLLKLRSLVLQDNPWICNCHLREFRNWVIERNLYAVPTACTQPEHLRGKMWNAINAKDFACKPKILWPPIGTSVSADNRDVSLGCKVTGNPMPEVHWVHNSKIISDSTKVKYSVNRYTIKTSLVGSSEQPDRWVNLTVNQVGLQDKGQFQCVAKSPGGLDERNVTLLVYADNDGFIGVGSVNDSWPLIIGLCTGMAALLIIILLLCCWYCCRHKQSQSKKSATAMPANGDVMHRITPSNEQEKSLLTVNPVQKPPRRYEAQINNDSVEISELNRKLLDENSLQGNTCPTEEENSVECLDIRQEGANVEKPASEAHPPDLLSFPSRSHNISPASSSTSNGFDNLSRASLYPAMQQSLLNPSVHYNCGTLPYSRSHSPFSPTAPIVLPRQGYVTIPRRPRVPSWSSAPTPSLLDDPLSPIKAEPVYDNLGPRTTADGSSVLSLNKSFSENPRGRNSSSNVPNYFHFEGGLRPSPSPLSPERENRADGILKRTCSADGDIGPIRSKVAPKPPPKPKKDGPLFEDEGEDGTEV